MTVESPSIPTSDVPLEPLLQVLDELLAQPDVVRCDPLCVRAHIADWFRRQGRDPMDALQFTDLSVDLDTDGWQRLALLESLMNAPELTIVLVGPLRDVTAHDIVATGLLGVARHHRLLTIDLLRRSPLRREELARGWLHSVGLTVTGESAEASERKRHRLDYATTLAHQREAQDEASSRKDYLEHLWSKHA